MSKSGKTTDELIHAVAGETGEAVREQLEALLRECCNYLPNYYKAMQELLRKYKQLKALAEMEDEYMLLRERDKSITVAPPSGGVPRDIIEVREEKLEARREAYAITMTQFDRLDKIVKMFVDKPEFVVIRMRYFGEDCDGNERPPRERPYTFEDMAADMESAGHEVTVKKLHKWDSGIIKDMVVLMWGVKGAVSLQTPRRFQRDVRNG